MTESTYFRRERYLQYLHRLQASGTSAMVTGMSGCGKTVLMETFAEKGTDTVDLTDHRRMDSSELGEILDSAVSGDTAVIDGATDIPGWEDEAERLRSYGKVVFVTCPDEVESRRVRGTSFGRGLAEVRVRPFSFAETVAVRDETDPRALLYDYLHFGGMPEVVVKLNASHSDARSMIPGMLDMLIADASYRSGIRDTEGMRVVYSEILRDTTLRMSPKEVSDRIKARGTDVTRYLARKYAAALRRRFMFDIPKVSVMGPGEPGSRYEWYLPADMGLAVTLNGYDTEEALRNAVYKEMVYRDPDACLCRMNRGEVGFVSTASGSPEYVQTSAGVHSDRAGRAVDALSRSEGGSRILVTEKACPDFDAEGIRAVNLRKWMFEGNS